MTSCVAFSQWIVQREGPLLKCTSVVTGQAFYDRAEPLWQRTRLSTLLRVGEAVSRMAESKTFHRGHRILTSEWRIDETRPGCFWATDLATGRLVTWFEPNPENLESSDRFKSTELFGLMKLAVHVRATIYRHKDPSEAAKPTPQRLEGWLEFVVGRSGLLKNQWKRRWVTTAKRSPLLVDVWRKGELVAEFDMAEAREIRFRMKRHRSDRRKDVGAFLVVFLSLRAPLKFVARGAESIIYWQAGFTQLINFVNSQRGLRSES